MTRVVTLRLPLFMGMLLCVSCTHTKMTALKDPDVPSVPYKRLLVVAAFSDLESRDRVETRFVRSLARVGINAAGSMRVILPTRQYPTHDDVRRAVEPTGADAILLLRVTEVSAQPEGTITVGWFTPSSWIVGSYTVVMSKMRSEVRLINTQSGATSWIGTARTGSSKQRPVEAMIASLAGSTAEQLREEHLVAAKDE
jgi:hypothetical protein